MHGRNSFSAITLSDSEQIENLEQQDQFINPSNAILRKGNCPIPHALMTVTPVYSENSNDASSTTSYRYEWGNSQFSLSTGTAG